MYETFVYKIKTFNSHERPNSFLVLIALGLSFSLFLIVPFQIPIFKIIVGFHSLFCGLIALLYIMDV